MAKIMTIADLFAPVSTKAETFEQAQNDMDRESWRGRASLLGTPGSGNEGVGREDGGTRTIGPESFVGRKGNVSK
ncbi:MAG TPA: hypothetical protein VN039_06045 [Nitrospira sp.]|nr:hypothetical protein [Nitrospira sp.]